MGKYDDIPGLGEQGRDRLKALQEELAARVDVRPGQGFAPAEGDAVLSLDIQYQGERAHVAGDLTRWKGEHLGTWAGLAQTNFPYVPGYFCFREGPPLLALVQRLLAEGLPRPQVMIIDGHGVAHPRLFGVACWMGLATGIPAVGCAKETLVRFSQRPQGPRGSWSPVSVGDQRVGAVLRTQDDVKPLYVSPGHLVDLERALALVMGLEAEYRVPEALRRADLACRARSRGESDPGWVDLGELAPAAPPWRQEVTS
jgi:deoxyribonuclease V